MAQLDEVPGGRTARGDVVAGDAGNAEDQLAGYVDVARKAVTYNGQVYGVPYTVENLALFRNTELAPEAPGSFDELVETGKKLKAAGKVEEIVGYPVSQQDGQSGDTYHLYPLYTSVGAHLFGTTPGGDPDPSDLGVGDRKSVEAFERIAKLGEKGEGALKRSFTSDNSAAAFNEGRTAFMVAGPWRLARRRGEHDRQAPPGGPRPRGGPAHPAGARR